MYSQGIPATLQPNPIIIVQEQENTIEELVSQAANECFNAIENSNIILNAVMIEKKIHNIKYLALGILKPVSPTDPFWKDEVQTLGQICFFVHLMSHIGNGGVKEVFEIRRTYRIVSNPNDPDSLLFQLIKHVEKYAMLILKKETEAAANELALLKKISHKNIIRMISDYKINYISDKMLISKTILMEELMTGDMKKLYSDTNFNLSLKQAKSIVNQVLSAFEYLQSINLAHADIKLQNCLYKWDSNEIIIKISDFESGFDIKQSKFSKNYTPPLAPPELVARFVNQRFHTLFIDSQDQELKQAYSDFLVHFPLNAHVPYVNHWGAGILIRETFLKLIEKRSNWHIQFPWAGALDKINKWALPLMYPGFIMTSQDLGKCIKEVVNAFENCRLENTEDPQAEIIGGIAIGFLKLQPNDRISFKKARERLDPLLKRKISLPSSSNKKIKLEKENQNPNILRSPLKTLPFPKKNDSQSSVPLDSPFKIKGKGDTQPYQNSLTTP